MVFLRHHHESAKPSEKVLKTTSVPLDKSYKDSVDFTDYIPLNKQNCIDLINGAACYCSGGGGAKSIAMKFLDYAVEITGPNKVVELTQFDLLQDSDYIVAAACMGSPEAVTTGTLSDQALQTLVLQSLLGWKKANSLPLTTLVGVEAGPANSTVPILVSAYENQSTGTGNCRVLDGDLQGRSVLSLTMLGPYMFGIDMKGTCYSYVCKTADVPSNALSYDFITINNTRVCVAACQVPDQYSEPSQTESYLSGVLNNLAYPQTVLSVIFNPIYKHQLYTRFATSFTSPNYLGLKIVPNTMTRSLDMGERLRTTDFDVTTEIVNAGGELLCDGVISMLFVDSTQRSDPGYYIIKSNNGLTTFAGIFNNETFLYGPLMIINRDITLLLANSTSPTTIGLYLRDIDGVVMNTFLTNDELLSFQDAVNKGAKLNVVAYTIPPSPLLLSNEALTLMQPSAWGVKTLPGFNNDFSQCGVFFPINLFKAPTYHNAKLFGAHQYSVPMVGSLEVKAEKENNEKREC